MKYLALIPALLACVLPAGALAGSLEPPAPPTNPASAMFTLEDIYMRMTSGAPGAKRTGAFVSPLAAPTNSTGHSLNDIMGVLPTVMDGRDTVTAMDVPGGLQFWCLTESGWGLQWGTMVYDFARRRGEQVRTLTASSLPVNTGGSGKFQGEFIVSNKTVTVVDDDGTPMTVTNAVNNMVQFEIPSGTGTKYYTLRLDGVDVKAYVYLPNGNNTTLIETNALPLTYDSPEITRVSGGTDTPPATYNLSTLGGEGLIISGTNFGTNAGVVSVTLGGLPCGPAAFVGSDITCTTPANAAGGWDLDVTVTVDGLSDTKPWASYAGPLINPVSLSVNGGPAGPSIDLTSCDGGDSIHFTGSGFGSVTGDVTVKYGPANYDWEDLPYSATVTNVSDTEIYCISDDGIGANMVFQVRVNGVTSQEGSDTASYPAPMFLTNTFRLAEIDPGTTNLLGVVQDERLYFGVTNAGSEASFITVYIADPGGPYTDACMAFQLHPSNTASCVVPKGTGTKILKLNAVGAWSPESTDTYTYPDIPVITNIACWPSALSCPTEGGSFLTIEGTNFSSTALSVIIGGTFCETVMLLSPTQIACFSPPGTGTNVPVIVKCGDKTSLPATGLFGYAPPSLGSIDGDSGVTRVGNTIVDIPREGGVELIITGDNFGPSGAQIIAGGLCTGVRHDSQDPNHKIYGMIPHHFGPPYYNIPVYVINSAGIVSTNKIYVTYLE